MLLRRIPICHFIAAAITPANRFYWVREHELVQIILHRPNADVKFHSQIRGRVKAPAQQCLPYCALTLCYCSLDRYHGKFRIRVSVIA